MTDTKTKTKVALVTNIPAPYRLPIYESVARSSDVDLTVFFCSGREPDRVWDLAAAQFQQVFLKEKFISVGGKFIHCNPDVWSALKVAKPDVVITTGFNPTFILAYLYARWAGARHIAMTDGTDFTESHLSGLHRWVRRWIYGRTSAFLGASMGSFRLYRSYGVPEEALFQSHLCANNAAFVSESVTPERVFDLVFSARFVAGKNPLFALKVAQGVARALGRRVRLLLLGSGELQGSIEQVAQEIKSDVDVVFAGFVKQADLPRYLYQAKVMLFPTQIDTWGVVANEACAAGVPVIVTPMAGVAHELVVDGETGYVCDLDVGRWVELTCRLLTDEALRARLAVAATQRVKAYSFNHAADGILGAIRFATVRAA
jgi:glycosyltransferase involved in cell wall biosynthesis